MRQKDSSRRGVTIESCSWISLRARTFGRLKCARTHTCECTLVASRFWYALKRGPLGDRRFSSHHTSGIHAHTCPHTHTLFFLRQVVSEYLHAFKDMSICTSVVFLRRRHILRCDSVPPTINI